MTIKLDVLLIQLINIGILFRVFRNLVGKVLTAEIVRRKEALKKIAHAQETYEAMISDAKREAEGYVKEGLVRKEEIVWEAAAAAQKKAHTLVHDAEQQASKIVEEATLKAQHMERDLQESFIEGVKNTACLVVKKLFDKDVSLQEEYVKTLAEEFKRSA